MKYDFKKIEKNSQDFWAKSKVFETKNDSSRKKFYVLDMFPYPSGDGLHVGHIKGYTATDIVANYMRMKGFNVLHPMGWDAFGLPAENYAIKIKKNPKEVVAQNIAKFKGQLQSLGFSYDWSREINTTDPEYYKWTQWIFIKLFEKGLAYQDEIPINFCPSCKTGLANEEVQSGECERCHTKVERKNLKQWILKITDYADRLLNDLEDLDWPEPIKEMQKNWIGRSEGSEIKFQISNSKLQIKVYTTRADTLFGCTWVVLAPENDLVKQLESKIENLNEVKEYIEKSKNKSDLERTELAKEKTGVELRGLRAVNPINGKEVPVWIADYVLAHYGTGAVMAVPAHDQRDFEFAKKYNLLIKEVVIPTVTDPIDPPKPDEPVVFRNAIQAIVINPNNNKILTLCWQKQPWTTFITGGIDDGEDATEAAKREIYEETGYKNLKFIRKLGGLVDSNFYANHKKENRKAHFQALVFELLDEEKDQISDKESAIHQLVWKTWEEIKNDGNLKCSEFNIWLDRFSNPENAFEDHGILINSNSFNGSDSETAKRKITEKLRKSGHGDFAINYKLRDWVFSRQRYWGEPIPIVHCKKCALRDPSGQGVVAVPEDQLPVKLPEIENYEPSGDGTSPLSRVESWVNTKCPKCGSEAKRETDTMPQWAGSCWYYLRFTDPKNDNKLISNEADKYFSPIDLYIGGAEHAVLHLLYARFWHKFLFDLKVVNFKEPFKKLKNVGLILAPDRQKMSKSRGNVISPEEIIGQFGADSLRMYEMFIGPFDQPAVWAKNGITGVSRFLENVCLSFEKNNKKDETIGTNLSQLINLITQKIEKSLFNTAVSDFMKFAKTVELTKMNKEQWDVFLKLLSPFAPHLSEKLWLENSNSNSIFSSLWPEAQNIEQQNYNLVVQINGKRKAVLEINKNLDRKEIENLVLGQKKIAFEVKRDKIKKIIFVEKKLINFVV